MEIDSSLDQELENILNHPAPAYGEKDYWNERYQSDSETFEWLAPWPIIQQKLGFQFKSTATTLVIGCGSSNMSFEIHNEVAHVTSIDFSDVIISKMKAKYSSYPSLEWQVADCTSLPFGPGQFDYVLDKATIDTLFCYELRRQSVASALKEAFRVLKPGGMLILVTYGNENTRNKLFESCGFTIRKLVPVEGVSHYAYLLKKPE